MGARELREVGAGEAGVVDKEVDSEDPGGVAEQGADDASLERGDEEEEEQLGSAGWIGGLEEHGAGGDSKGVFGFCAECTASLILL